VDHCSNAVSHHPIFRRLVLSFETHIMAGLQHGRDFTGKTGEKTNTDGVKAELVKAEGIKREKNETEVIKTEIKEEDVKAEPRVTRSNRQRRSVSTDSVSNTSVRITMGQQIPCHIDMTSDAVFTYLTCL